LQATRKSSQGIKNNIYIKKIYTNINIIEKKLPKKFLIDDDDNDNDDDSFFLKKPKSIIIII